MVNLVNVADFIIETVKEESELSGFQNIVEFKTIEEKFDIKLDQRSIIGIADLLFSREEIAVVELDNDIKGFDVVIYTDFAPNYQEEEYFEN